MRLKELLIRMGFFSNLEIEEYSKFMREERFPYYFGYCFSSLIVGFVTFMIFYAILFLA